MEKDRLEGNIYSGFLKWRSVPKSEKKKDDRIKISLVGKEDCPVLTRHTVWGGTGRGEEMLWDQSAAPASAGPPSASSPSVQRMSHLPEHTRDSHRTVMLKQHRCVLPMSPVTLPGSKSYFTALCLGFLISQMEMLIQPYQVVGRTIANIQNVPKKNVYMPNSWYSSIDVSFFTDLTHWN